MSMKRDSFLSIHFAFQLILILAFILAACGTGGTPTLISPPEPTLAPTFKLNVDIPMAINEGSMSTIREQESAAISINIEPYTQLDWTWEISGTSGGKLNTYTGENVIYTAGKTGIDTVSARATLANGAPIKQSVEINVAPPVTETPPPTQTALPPRVTLDNLQDNQKVSCSNVVGGTYPDQMDKAIWPVVFVGGVYHPQDEGGKAAQKANGKWFQTVRFGDCINNPNANIGQPFQLIIVTANESANAAFEAYVTNGKKTGKWPGMSELPAGVEEQVRVVVIRE